MALASVSSLVDALRGQGLLGSDQLDTVVRDLQHQHTDPRSLAADLIRRDWLTPFQVNQLLQERVLTLGGYVLLERLGEGGMGQVFKARHLRLGRLAAIKVIRPEVLAQPSVLLRFQREARAAAHLSHPNIVSVYDFAEDGDTHFLVMEYVQGIDLARHLQEKGPLPVGQACEYIRQTALGLQHAHERGLVHRDIKPHNLLLASGQGGGSRSRQTSGPEAPGTLASSATDPPPSPARVKILDMGLARGPQAPGEDGITHEGVVVGTLDYLAPEQARNSRGIDPRSDLYSLGCTFYHLLAGVPPFGDATGFEKLLKHQLDDPPPLEQVRPNLPANVLTIIHKLMAKRIEDRYQSAAEVAAVLAEYLDHHQELTPTANGTVPATSTSPQPPTVILNQQTTPPEALGTTLMPPPRRRRKWLYVLTGIAALLLILVALNDRKEPAPKEDEDSPAIPKEVLADPLLRVLPEQTVGLVRIETRPFLDHPWIKKHYRDTFRQVARENSKVKQHVPAAGDEFWERIDRLAVSLGPDEKAGDVWAVQGPQWAAAVSLFAGPRQKEPDGRARLRVLPDSTMFLADLDADTAVFSTRKPPLFEIVDRKRDAIPLRVASLLRKRQPADILWLHLHRDGLTRFPESTEYLSTHWKMLREEAEAVRVGLALDGEVRLRVVLAALRPEGVKPLEEMASKYLDLVRDAPVLLATSDELAPILPLLNTGKLSTSGHEVMLECAMETEALLKAIEKLKTEAKKWKKP